MTNNMPCMDQAIRKAAPVHRQRNGAAGSFGWHPFWDLTAFDRHDGNRKAPADRAGSNRKTLYPTRALRYWFMDHLLRQEYVRRNEQLTIGEIGVADGPLLAFVKRVVSAPGNLPDWVKTWDAISRRIDGPKLRAIGYSRCLDTDVEQGALALPGLYDVVILLHLLEHLKDPEAAVARILPFVKPGGLFIGGGPTLPDLLRPARERYLRKRAEPFGHVSVISARRLRQLAWNHHLKVELLTGGAFIRATGSFLENFRVWLRLNLICGALAPGWPGELYWALRTPR